MHKAEAANNPDNYNKTDQQHEGPIVTTTRLAIVKTNRWINMLKAWFHVNSDTQPIQPHPPRRWPFFLTFVCLSPLLLFTFVGFHTWLSASIPEPRLNSEDEITSLLTRYGLITKRTQFGETLIPTPFQQRHSPLGPDLYRVERAIEIFNCSSRYNWSNKTHGKPTTASVEKATTNLTTFLSEACPSYFSWIHEDLAPWKESGISRTTLEMGKEHAALRAIILNGMLYMDLYYPCFQTRLLFNVWGLLLLLEKYKNRIPDVEVMFNCWDRPLARVDTKLAIPLFSYSSNREFYDIPWPDWSFFGWSELQIESWDQEFDKIVKGSRKKDWRSKPRKAFWSGNPFVSIKDAPYREELLACSQTKDNKIDVAIRVKLPLPIPRGTILQDWSVELKIAKQHSKLENQCTHRYMAYVEGVSWSVSLKYIMACGSPTMVISPDYYDFYMRGLQPGVHYIRVEPSNGCVSKLCQKFNDEVNHAELDPFKAQAIGKAGQAFIGKEVGMDKVYDYMFHVLNEYAKLQDFKPRISESAQLVTQDYILCLAQPLQRLLLHQARKLVPSSVAPCSMSDRQKGSKDFGWEASKHVNNKC